MKKFNGRLVAGLLVPLAIGGTLAGCGDDNDSAGNASTATTPAQTTPKPTASAADVDKAFVRQMVPHHKMAVEMAQMAARSSEHEEIKTLSSEIISAQNKEISELEAIAKELGVTPGEAMSDSGSMEHGEMTADAKTLGLTMDQMGMSMDMTALESANPFDEAFIDQMTVHHQGAIAMAKAELAGGENAELQKIATAIVSAQEKEIAQMAQWKADWYPDGSGTGEQTGDEMSDDMSGMGH